MKVEVVIDILCAWSYMGVTRLRRAAGRLRAEGGDDVEMVFLPFELAPHAPPGGGMPLLEALRAAFGEHAAADTARVAGIAAGDGLTLNYDRGIATNTFQAHRLIQVAAGQDRAEPMVERLFRAHFTDGLHVGDPEVLKRLATEVGVRWSDEGDAETRALLAKVRANGITGVPVFMFEGGQILSGAQPEDALLGALRAAAPAANPS